MAAKARRRRTPSRADKKVEKVEAKKPEVPSMPLMGIVTWTDPLKQPLWFELEAPFDPETEAAQVVLSIRLRSVASIELRPARRSMQDIEGHASDAVRLANN